MELYTSTSYELSKKLTNRYSTSFSMSSRLFDGTIRQHIYAIYGLVRIADEIVDTYTGGDQERRLEDLQLETAHAIQTGYSVNPIVHSFAQTARAYGITDDLLLPFFASMKADITQKTFTKKEYDAYIYGSAEVVGLMCLRVFVGGDKSQYDALEQGARSLGAAYQKINFLRDIKSDYMALGRMYFPDVQFDLFSENDKQTIIDDIEHDLAVAERSMAQLPTCAQAAVKASYYYYSALLRKLKKLSVAEILSGRVRIANSRKIILLMKARLGI